MWRWLVPLLLVPQLAAGEERDALVFDAKELEIAAKPREAKGLDVKALVAAAYPNATAVDAMPGSTPLLTFVHVLPLDLVTRSSTGWGKERHVVVFGCVGTYSEPDTGASSIQCTPELTALVENDGVWKPRAKLKLARSAIDWEIAGGNDASTYLRAISYWPVAKQRSQVLEAGVIRKTGGERSKETTSLGVYWLEDGALREVLALSYPSAEQNARGRRDVVNTIAELDEHATKGVPDLEVREQTTTFANGKEQMKVRAFHYKWNGKKFVRTGSIQPSY